MLWKKYCTAGQTTDDMAHAHCVLDTQGYKHSAYAMRISFPLQKWVCERALILHVHCLYCLMAGLSYNRLQKFYFSFPFIYINTEYLPLCGI